MVSGIHWKNFIDDRRHFGNDFGMPFSAVEKGERIGYDEEKGVHLQGEREEKIWR